MKENTRMMWHDPDPKRSLEEKIIRAKKYYQDKYGFVVDICSVHPDMLAEKTMIDGVEVIPSKIVLPNHFWIGKK